jgi:hypothetical protein
MINLKTIIHNLSPAKTSAAAEGIKFEVSDDD